MSLKAHNNIVQQLLKQLDTKDTQIQSLKKQLHKANALTPQTQLTDNQKQLNKKINLLHKQYKDKINGLNQNIRNKSLENKDLKERIILKKNQQLKEKQQLTQILKKFDLTSVHDPKFSAMITHYQKQIYKKNLKINILQKQMKQLTINKNIQQNYNNQHQSDNSSISDNQQQTTKQNQKINNNLINNQQHYHTKYQQQINALKNDSNKYQKLLQEKSKQFKDLTKRYSDLTKQYYKVLNQYGTTPPPPNKSTPKISKTDTNPPTTLSQQSSQQPSIQLSYSFLPNFDNPHHQPSDTHLQHKQLSLLQDLFDNVMEILGIDNRMEIIPTITNMKINCQNTSLYHNICIQIQQLLHRVLSQPKPPISQLSPHLTTLQHRLNTLLQNQHLLTQLCIEAGSPKPLLLQKLQDLKIIQQQFFNNMKDINFVQELHHSNKIIQFIQYFQLDKQQYQLPQQLLKLYQQIKSVDKFLKQANLILQKQPQQFQRALQMILRYLERKQAQQLIKNKEGNFGRNGNGNGNGKKNLGNK